MSEFNSDVVIVGAGPTGLMCAALLLRAGVKKIRILDKSPTAAKESRAFAVQPRSLELFLSMGLADEFMQNGLITQGAQIYVDGKQREEIDFGDIGRRDTPFGFIFMIPQNTVEEILNADIERLGVKVERGVEVTGFDQSIEGATLQIKHDGNAASIKCGYVIGADGAHSIIRHALGLSFEGAAYEQEFMLADCKLDWDLNDDRFKVFLRGREFALYFPLKNSGHGRVIAIKPFAEADTDATIERQGSAPATLDEVQDAFRAASGLAVNLSDAQWVSRYRVHHRGVNKYSKGRAFVAGDAAHIHSPIGGQGMNTGLQDAANLCWKLAMVLKGAASNALLDTYHTERWPVGQKLLHMTDRAFVAISSQHKWVTALRNMLMPMIATLVEDFRFFRRKVFGFVSQLNIRYQGHGFLQDDMLEPDLFPHATWKKHLVPGMRAPNADIAHKIDVFSLITGYQFHVLAFSSAPLGDAAIKSLVADFATLPTAAGLPIQTHIIANSLVGRDARIVQAERRDVFETYLMGEVREAIYFIRPDGYIAYRCDRFDIESLRWFIKERLTGIG